MNAEPGLGELMEEVESEEIGLRVVDLGDAVVETRQVGPGLHIDSAWVPSAFPRGA